MDFAELKSLVQAQLVRTGAGDEARVTQFIALGEGHLNRKLGSIVGDSVLTGVAASNEIDVSALSIRKAVDLWRIDENGNETRLKPLSGFEIAASSGTPVAWEWDRNEETIRFDCPLSTAWTFRLRHEQRYNLSSGQTTNWLIEFHPDVYFASVMVYGALYWPTEGAPDVSQWKGLLAEAIPEIRKEIADSKKSEATIDPALLGAGRFNFSTGE